MGFTILRFPHLCGFSEHSCKTWDSSWPLLKPALRGFSRRAVPTPHAQQEDITEASSSPFFRPAPVISYERTQACGACGGVGTVQCDACDGSGRLPAGGYHPNNPVSAARIINSKWTAVERTLGWRHFIVTQKRKQAQNTFVLLVATCDPAVQLWVNLKNLKSRQSWLAGWLQKEELLGINKTGGGAYCKKCRSLGRIPCRLCSLAGEVIEV